MQVTHVDVTSGGAVLGAAAVAWLAASAWIMERITASLYDAAYALIKTAATAAGS